MNNNLFPLTQFDKTLNKYLPYNFPQKYIYQSHGLVKHIQKRHPECLPYLNFLDSIIRNPDYIGINPNEISPSFELVKVLSENIQIGIKLDIKND